MNTRIYKEDEFLAGLDLSYYIPQNSRILLDNRVTVGPVIGFSVYPFFNKIKMSLSLFEKINPSAFNLKGIDITSDRLNITTFSSESFISLINDSGFPFQAGMLASIRYNFAQIPDVQGSTTSTGLGAGLWARIYLGKLQEFFLDIKGEYTYDFYKDWNNEKNSFN